MGFRAGLDAVEQRKFWTKPGLIQSSQSSRQLLVHIPTALPRLLVRRLMLTKILMTGYTYIYLVKYFPPHIKLESLTLCSQQ
jgi:hypothetical protein